LASWVIKNLRQEFNQGEKEKKNEKNSPFTL